MAATQGALGYASPSPTVDAEISLHRLLSFDSTSRLLLDLCASKPSVVLQCVSRNFRDWVRRLRPGLQIICSLLSEEIIGGRESNFLPDWLLSLPSPPYPKLLLKTCADADGFPVAAGLFERNRDRIDGLLSALYVRAEGEWETSPSFWLNTNEIRSMAALVCLCDAALEGAPIKLFRWSLHRLIVPLRRHKPWKRMFCDPVWRYWLSRCLQKGLWEIREEIIETLRASDLWRHVGSIVDEDYGAEYVPTETFPYLSQLTEAQQTELFNAVHDRHFVGRSVPLSLWMCALRGDSEGIEATALEDLLAAAVGGGLEKSGGETSTGSEIREDSDSDAAEDRLVRFVDYLLSSSVHAGHVSAFRSVYMWVVTSEVSWEGGGVCGRGSEEGKGKRGISREGFMERWGSSNSSWGHGPDGDKLFPPKSLCVAFEAGIAAGDTRLLEWLAETDGRFCNREVYVLEGETAEVDWCSALKKLNSSMRLETVRWVERWNPILFRRLLEWVRLPFETAAVETGDIPLLSYLEERRRALQVEMQLPLNEDTVPEKTLHLPDGLCRAAAEEKQWEVLRWLRLRDPPYPWSDRRESGVPSMRLREWQIEFSAFLSARRADDLSVVPPEPSEEIREELAFFIQDALTHQWGDLSFFHPGPVFYRHGGPVFYWFLSLGGVDFERRFMEAQTQDNSAGLPGEDLIWLCQSLLTMFGRSWRADNPTCQRYCPLEYFRSRGSKGVDTIVEDGRCARKEFEVFCLWLEEKGQPLDEWLRYALEVGRGLSGCQQHYAFDSEDILTRDVVLERWGHGPLGALFVRAWSPTQQIEAA
uniref:Uncharacterized protein n=1 Tax=Chromera velia CCMP2878 TaxID=1169474 RepID=A0A0G4FTW2_9ALVE|eukprot:Cvel_18731.t1-p1 / transcript=Cvel_18731.t1 / gene=Cvel_18731 / organism=Chromera_velia_CCMP2878 / gene_product=hypothetical protein / transcript_product=hypothetical protein / location=Cvel_scaffold1570:40273-43096(-) / protein_length=814 / sequence_SO=supercontig / SO=protein_coding / is_pseudo=false